MTKRTISDDDDDDDDGDGDCDDDEGQSGMPSMKTMSRTAMTIGNEMFAPE